MVIKMHRLIRTFSFSASVLLLTGCVSSGNTSEIVQMDTGSKFILIGANDVETLRQVLNDWDDIAEAIYQFRPMSCVKESLTLDSIVTLENHVGLQKEKYLTRAGLNDSSEDIKALSIGTEQICIIDPGSSGPAWITLYIDGVYQVIGETSLSE